MSLELAVIPTGQRYGYCEACSIVDRDDPQWRSYRFRRKPVYVVDGERLCRRCSPVTTA